MTKATATPVVPVVPVAPKATFWSTVQDFFGMSTVGISTITTGLQAVNDLVVAAQAQTSIIKDTSINDAELKRIALDARLAARKAQALPDSSDL